MLLKSYEHFHLLTYTGRTNARQSLITVLRTSGQIMLKCISEQYLIKIYHVVQELCAFSFINHDGPHRCLVKPHLRFAYQCLDNV